jgi:formylglycine-generating enzyme required for sulfatase activity
MTSHPKTTYRTSATNRAQEWKAKRIFCASLVVALTALAGCRASTRAISGRNGADALLDPSGYVAVAPGDFVMGSPNPSAKSHRAAAGSEANERPQRRVKISKGFEMGKFEVTQDQWQSVMNTNPSSFKGPQLPVMNVSWNDAQEFLTRLQSFDPQHVYRLPTEAEWEYACRAAAEGEFSAEERDAAIPNAGAEKPGSAEEAEKILSAVSWFGSNAFNHPHPVGHLKPNAWGLYDMRGNVREWCQDWYDSDFYRSKLVENPQGPATGTTKVNRGCSWQSPASQCRSAARSSDLPTERNNLIGLRIVRVKK